MTRADQLVGMLDELMFLIRGSQDENAVAWKRLADKHIEDNGVTGTLARALATVCDPDMYHLHHVAAKDAMNPVAFNRRVKELRRGGLPASSMSDGRKGAESPFPGPDKFDGQLQEAGNEFSHQVMAAVRAARRARSRYDFVMVVRAPSPEKKRCSNVFCKGPMVEDDADRAECPRCRQHRHRHGSEWRPREEAAS